MYVPTAMVWLIGRENVFKVLLLIFYVILIKNVPHDIVFFFGWLHWQWHQLKMQVVLNIYCFPISPLEIYVMMIGNTVNFGLFRLFLLKREYFKNIYTRKKPKILFIQLLYKS